MDKNLYMNCACRGSIRFIICSIRVNSYEQSAYLEVLHDGRYLWSGRVGGHNWYERSDNKIVAARIIGKIYESVVDQSPSCKSLFEEAYWVLKQIIKEDAS